MSSTTKLNGVRLGRMMIAGANELASNKQLVDAMNVFPVPDGDTGTNMSLTVMAAAREAEKNGSLQVADIAKAASGGALRGARGNSGGKAGRGNRRNRGIPEGHYRGRTQGSGADTRNAPCVEAGRRCGCRRQRSAVYSGGRTQAAGRRFACDFAGRTEHSSRTRNEFRFSGICRK